VLSLLFLAKNRVANSPGLTLSLRVLAAGLQVPGLVLQSPGCQASLLAEIRVLL